MAYNVILLLSRMHIYVTSKFVKVGSKPNSELEVAAFPPVGALHIIGRRNPHMKNYLKNCVYFLCLLSINILAKQICDKRKMTMATPTRFRCDR